MCSFKLFGSVGNFTVFPIFSNPRGSIKFMNLLNIDGEGEGEEFPFRPV
jgi:hypothetical protein